MLCPSCSGGTRRGHEARGQTAPSPHQKPQGRGAHLDHVHASLQPGRALEVAHAPQVLVAGERAQGSQRWWWKGTQGRETENSSEDWPCEPREDHGGTWMGLRGLWGRLPG